MIVGKSFLTNSKLLAIKSVHQVIKVRSIRKSPSLNITELWKEK